MEYRRGGPLRGTTPELSSGIINKALHCSFYASTVVNTVQVKITRLSAWNNHDHTWGRSCIRTGSRDHLVAWRQYIKLGFTFVEDGGIHLSKYVACDEELSNGVKKDLSCRIYTTPFYQKAFSVCMKRKLSWKTLKCFINFYNWSNDHNYRLFRSFTSKYASWNTFTQEKYQVLPCVVKGTRKFLANLIQRKLKELLFQTLSLGRIIKAITSNVEYQLITKYRDRKYSSLQLDEWYYVTNKAILIASSI